MASVSYTSVPMLWLFPLSRSTHWSTLNNVLHIRCPGSQNDAASLCAPVTQSSVTNSCMSSCVPEHRVRVLGPWSVSRRCWPEPGLIRAPVSPSSSRSRPWHDFGRQAEVDKIHIPKCQYLPALFSRQVTIFLRRPNKEPACSEAGISLVRDSTVVYSIHFTSFQHSWNIKSSEQYRWRYQLVG